MIACALNVRSKLPKQGLTKYSDCLLPLTADTTNYATASFRVYNGMDTGKEGCLDLPLNQLSME